MLSNYLALAQTDPCFDADFVKGCVPLTVNMIDCSGADADLIFYDYGDGPTTATSYTFNKAGLYAIKQLLNSGNGGKELLKTDYIEVVEVLPISVEVTVCEGKMVQVSLKDDYYNKYIIDFGDGTSQTVTGLNDITHTYSDEVQKTITIKGFFDNQGTSCAEITKTITPIGEINPANFTSVELSDSNTAQLNFTLSSGINYQLEQSIDGAAFTVVANLSNVSTYTVTSLNPSETSTFRIAAISPCGTQAINSREINTNFLKVDVQSGVNELRWTKSKLVNFERFQILKNGIEIASYSQNDSTILLDSAIACNQEYCYKIIAFADGEQIQSISQTICVKAEVKADLDPITNIIASVNEEGQVVLSWDLPSSAASIQELQILRLSDSTDSVEINIASAEIYIDSSASPSSSQYCYKVTYQDACGNQASASPTVCAIFLTGEQNDTEVNLNWTEYDFFGNNTSTDTTVMDTTVMDTTIMDTTVMDTTVVDIPITSETLYFVQKLDEDGNVYFEELIDGLSFTDILDDSDSQTVTYRIKACDSANPDVCVYSNPYTIFLSSYLKIPTAFSPNGDGLNDTFGVVGRSIIEIKMEIYNLWGNPIFKGTGEDVRWDGWVNGKEAPQATYAYYITAKDNRGRIYKRTGHIVLVK